MVCQHPQAVIDGAWSPTLTRTLASLSALLPPSLKIGLALASRLKLRRLIWRAMTG